MDTELKPCPFCGEEAGICEANDICFHRDDDGNKIFGGWRCFCPSCAIEQVGYETREEAVSAWNNRSTEHATHRAPVDEKGGGRMTGIDRLRELGNDYVENSWSEAGKSRGRLMLNIADQIERERACDSDTAENIRLIVGGVIDDMERHVLGHEGMEDSPVARWARELHEAMGDEKHDHASDVSMSAYDLLPEEEREAIAWVREHGGIESIKAQRRESMPRAAYERKKAGFLGHIAECEAALGRRREVISELNHRVCDLTRENAELRKRAMPEGYEWPRFEDGEPVRIGDVVSDVEVRSVVFRDGGILLSDCTSVPGWGTWRSYKEPIKRPAPKALDADGVEVRVGDTVWTTYGLGQFEVTRIVYADQLRVIADDEKSGHLNAAPKNLTHRAPVLAADGRPLREGETVWLITSGREIRVDKIEHRPEGFWALELFADGSKRHSAPVSILAHERPVADTWERLEEDVANASCPDVYCANHHIDASDTSYEWAMARDIVRRAKKLAGDA